MHLTPDERIDLRIEVNLWGKSIADVAKKYRVTEERVEELCNIQNKSPERTTEIRYKQSRGLLEQWPELDLWLNEHNLNITALCRIVGITPTTFTNMVFRKTLMRPSRKPMFDQICLVTGLENPIK
jgi:hypothetical protein